MSRVTRVESVGYRSVCKSGGRGAASRVIEVLLVGSRSLCQAGKSGGDRRVKLQHMYIVEF